MAKMPRDEVLCYRLKGAARETVRRHYLKWREEHGLPERCDNQACVFYLQPLIWNNKFLKPILDHKNGNNSDNRPSNLRLLCPNCDSQLADTRGGANKGRVEKSEGGFALVSKEDGKRNYIMPAEPGIFFISGQPAQLNIIRAQAKNEDSDL